MKITPSLSFVACLYVGLFLLATPGHTASDDEDSVLTSVYAKTEKSYRRKKDEKGRWVKEYYAMSNGGPVDGTIRDNAQDRIKFVAIATVLAQHLARQGYFPATEADKVDFLLVVNWGRTMPFADPSYRDGVKNSLSSMNDFALKSQTATAAREAAPQNQTGNVNLTGSVEEMEMQAAESYLEGAIIMQDMLNRSRNMSNARTAQLLGYMGNINLADGPQRYAGAGNLYDELIADIEEARYYIILSAYDFKRTVRENKPSNLRWVTRMSMRAAGNSFADKAAAMIAYSASRFGQNSDGLERKLYPQYKVNLEDLRFLGIAGWQGQPEAAEPAGQK